jgi:hypothetical protein
MKVIRFVATEDGESRFTELDIPIEQAHQDAFGNTMLFSNGFASPNVRFVEMPENLDQGWHGVSNPQIVIVLSGVLEVGTSDNQTRQWQAGDVFIADDTRSKGHTTRVVEGTVRLLFVPFPSDFVIENWSASW